MSAELAAALNDIGTFDHDLGRTKEAERAYKESIAIWERISESNPNMGDPLTNVAALRLQQGVTPVRRGCTGARNQLLFWDSVRKAAKLRKYTAGWQNFILSSAGTVKPKISLNGL